MYNKYKKVNSKKVVARVLNNYQIDKSDWLGRAPEWINEAIGKLNMYMGLTDASPLDIEIEDYTGTLPCNLAKIEAVEYDGYRMPRRSVINTKTASKIENLSSVPQYYYDILDDGTIVTSLEEGTITLYWKKLPIELDELSGLYYPLVIDNEFVLSAIENYLILSIVRRGYKVGDFSLSLNNEYLNPAMMWEKSIKAARNSVIIRDVDERQEISEMIRTFLVNSDAYYNEYFNNSNQTSLNNGTTY